MDNRLILLFSRAESKLRRYLIKESKDKNISVTPGQSGVLFLLLADKSQNMAELSKALEINNSAITRVVDKLENRGFVKREMNPNDRRQFLISLTNDGYNEAKKLKNIAHKANQKIKQGFSDEEIDIFKNVLNSFFDKFNIQ